MPSLSLPDPKDPAPTAEGLTRSEAVRLFLERARLRERAFGLSGHDARAVAEICQGLEGIPLAIEPAAARVGTLSAEQLAERLEDSLSLLVHGLRTAVPRHRTMRATLEWSYELLDEAEKKLFARLSVFAGGWTLEAAETVGSGDGIERGGILV